MADTGAAGSYGIDGEAMARLRIQIDGDEIFQQVMGTPQVQAAVYKEAAKIAARARRLDIADGRGAAQIKIDRVPLPSGRVAYNVTSSDVAGEYGTSEAKRLATLRRAAKGA